MPAALIILGHGSRAAGAADDMERVASGLRTRHSAATIRVAHMELCEPSLAAVVDELAGQGVTEALVLPYFLHRGNHLRLDIPDLLHDLAARHPSLRLTLGQHLGYDDAIVDLVEARWRASGLGAGTKPNNLPVHTH